MLPQPSPQHVPDRFICGCLFHVQADLRAIVGRAPIHQTRDKSNEVSLARPVIPIGTAIATSRSLEMIYGFDAATLEARDVTVTPAGDIRVRVLNCSASGCLLESLTPVTVGSMAMLRIEFSGGEFEDTVRVVRCHDVTGGHAVYHVATEFSTPAPCVQWLQYLIRREACPPGGSLRTRTTR